MTPVPRPKAAETIGLDGRKIAADVRPRDQRYTGTLNRAALIHALLDPVPKAPRDKRAGEIRVRRGLSFAAQKTYVRREWAVFATSMPGRGFHADAANRYAVGQGRSHWPLV